ncbi:cysteine peptidase family C39 domain-containing protein [Estrella lausannensis]|uniref:ABC-type transporter, ATPase subunit n=1 Tax=Estrella lausannensis TaxID=483423 RepID=A0A0H5DP92_9BACT|nr:cysteine peptidase family C39 domain-containing protein [Estrella lausannensis]CRX38336.1 ABC-type transporter, ATPase subunit [Estrella lausannensis]
MVDQFFRRLWRKAAVKTPHVAQFEAAECGAACLKIILDYFGRHIALEQLRLQCGVSRNGCNGYALLKAAKANGLDAEGYRISADHFDELQFPAILFWKGNHFVVIEDLTSRYAYINDPAAGRRKVTREEFSKGYSGLAFEMVPGENFVRTGSLPGIFSLAMERLQGSFPTLFFLLLAQTALSLLSLAPPIFSRVYLDSILSRGMYDWLWSFAGLMTLLTFLLSGFIFLQANTIRRLETKLSLIFSFRYLWHLLRLPVFFFYQRFGGEVIARMQLNVSIADMLSTQASMILLGFLTIFSSGFVIFQFSPAIAILALGIAMMNVLLLWRVAETRKSAYMALQQDTATITGVSLDLLRSIETIKTSGSENFFFSKIAGLTTKKINSLQNIGDRDAYLISFVRFSQKLAEIALIGLGGYKIMEGQLTVGMFIAFQALLMFFLRPFEQLVSMGVFLQTLKIDMQRVDDVLGNAPDATLKAKGSSFMKSASKSGHVLEFKNVAFGYSPLEEPLIHNFSFRLEQGRTIAIVGQSGAGKSTILRLALGLFSPLKGEIFIDGLSLSKFSRDEISQILSMVDQDFFLFEGSLRDNLTLWKPSGSDEQLKKNLEDACLAKELMALDGGLDYRVAQGGSNFSEGQKQRIEIARALFTNPSILLLDEATSALDADLEKDILVNLKKGGRGLLIISHRISVVQQADEVLWVENGTIQDRGTHAELMKKGGVYARFWEGAN